MQGLFLEDLEVGRIFEHAIRRTVTEMDNTLFSCLTHNPQPLHIDHDFAVRSEWGKPLVNSIFTLGLMIGISVNDTTLGTTIGNLGMSEVKFPKPVFHGDTLHVTTEVAARRESRSRSDAGIVDFVHRAFNQRNELVAQCRRQAMMRRRPKA
jgi:acyl dehydratase